MVASAFETTIVEASYVTVPLTGLHWCWLNAFAMHARDVRNNTHGFSRQHTEVDWSIQTSHTGISVADCDIVKVTEGGKVDHCLLSLLR